MTIRPCRGRRGARLIVRDCCLGQIRAGDIICRYGGEEFCVLLPNTDEPTAYTWTEQLRQTVAASNALRKRQDHPVNRQLWHSGQSAAIFRQEDLVRKADDSLRAAKLAGHRVVSWAEVDREDDSRELHRYAAIFQGLVARDIMTTPVTCLPTDMSVGDAAERFLRHEIDSAPIVNSDGSLAGIVSEKDIMEGLGHHEGWNALLAEIMTVRVIHYEPDTKAELIFEFLSRVQIHRVVIVENNRPVGLVSRGSFFAGFRTTSTFSNRATRRTKRGPICSRPQMH